MDGRRAYGEAWRLKSWKLKSDFSFQVSLYFCKYPKQTPMLFFATPSPLSWRLVYTTAKDNDTSQQPLKSRTTRLPSPTPLLPPNFDT